MKCTAWVTMLRNHTWFTGGLRRIDHPFHLLWLIETHVVWIGTREEAYMYQLPLNVHLVQETRLRVFP